MIINLLETAADLAPLEGLQRTIWPGSDAEIVPLHLLVTAAHNGGIVLGAFEDDVLVGFAFGFPGVHWIEGDMMLKHCSHMLGVHPEFRDRGVGFSLKRAQWQLVRNQDIPLITWTYDPLQSRNAFFNISKLGAICHIYLDDHYGEMRDGLNAGLPSDRFQVELWVNSPRVYNRFSRRPRSRLELEKYLAGGAVVINPGRQTDDGLPASADEETILETLESRRETAPILLLKIPSDIQSIKTRQPGTALRWRHHTRRVFTKLFEAGYLATDFVIGGNSRSSNYYVLSDGGAHLGEESGL